jgi:hypothetical protein
MHELLASSFYAAFSLKLFLLDGVSLLGPVYLLGMRRGS